MLSITEYKVGMTSEVTRSFTGADVDAFAELSGDINPVHLDENYAKKTFFGSRIVHGAFVSSIFSTIFANTLPGPGCIYLKSESKFLKPIFLDQSVLFKVEVIDVNVERKRVVFNTTAISNNQECVVGLAEIYIPE